MATVMPDTEATFPDHWSIASDWNPNKNLMNLRGKDYLNVQNRMIWFIKDQRDLIMRGLAQTSYAINTECVEMDREQGWAHFKTYVRDVLGNEATMYGSESMRDFPDYAEKASTKSLGRALAMLGYGTQFAPEMDEGERLADSPTESRAHVRPPERRETATQPAQATQTSVSTKTPPESPPSASQPIPPKKGRFETICESVGLGEAAVKMLFEYEQWPRDKSGVAAFLARVDGEAASLFHEQMFVFAWAGKQGVTMKELAAAVARSAIKPDDPQKWAKFAGFLRKDDTDILLGIESERPRRPKSVA